MAGPSITNRPAFITGANAKLKIGDLTVAYVMDLSYSLETETMPIEAFGKYEIVANEPTSFSVSGSFSVMRYTNALSTAIEGTAGGTGATALGLDKQMDPSRILLSKAFDLIVSQKHSLDGTTVVTKDYLGIYGCRITNRRATLTKRGVLIDTYSFIGVLAGDLDATVPPTRSSQQKDLT